MSIDDDPLALHIYTIMQALVPVAVIALCVLLSSISTPITPDMGLKPPFFLIALYYWSIFRPTMMPAWAAFIGGLCIDTITMMPLGIYALLYAAIRKFLTLQRTYIINQPFIIIWGVYALIYTLSLSIVSLIIQGNPFIPFANTHMLAALGINLAIFPFIFSLCHLTHIILLKPAPSPLDRKKRNIIIKRKNKTGLSV